MKNIYKILTLSFVAIIATSCDRDTGDYPYLNDRVNTIGYTSSSSTLFVEDGAANNVSIGVAATTTVGGGTFSISVDESSTAVEGVDFTIEGGNEFSFESGNIVSTFSIVGLFEGAIVEGKTVVLNLASTDFAVSASNQYSLSLVQLCPLEADFTGDYLIEQITPYVDGPTLDDGAIVTLYTTDGSEFQRGFLTANFTNYCSTPNEFLFELNCGKVTVPIENNCNCSCADNYFFGNPLEASEYNSDDDTQFELTFTDDVYGDCGSTTQTTYRFTKQ